jgi:ribosomal protein S18 acetylase RimI-like enzyme
MSEVEIRWAHADDWHDLAYVHTESFRSAYEGVIPDDFLNLFTVENREKYYRKSLSEGQATTALIFVDHQAMGCMVIGNCRDDDLDETYGEIWAIYLLKEYWGKGFGKRLISWGMDRLQESGYANVCLWVLKENTNARRFYEHAGFSFDGTEKSIIRGRELVQLRGCKSLV